MPTFFYQPRFSEAINKAKLDRLDLDRRKLEHRDDDDLRNLDKNRSKRKMKTNAGHHLHRMAKLWSPSGPKHCLAGIRSDEGITRESNDMVSELRSAWTPTFATAGQPSMYTQRVLDEWASPLDCSSVGTPSVADYSHFLGKAAHSAPGPDGIPFAAWENCGQLGAETLFLYGAHLAGGDVPHDDFNESVMVFVPKDVTEREEIDGDIVRGPMALRPLSLKSTDNKAIAGVTNNRLSPVLSKQSFCIQRGFIRGRSMLRNTLDLDTVMRLASFRTDLFPILVLFDFAAAFPSIFHCWLLTIIEFSGLPVGMINVIRAMYSNVKAFVH